MVNGVNSVINYRELQVKTPENTPAVKEKFEIKPLLKLQSIPNWHRRRLGTYPLWIVKPAAKISYFIFKRFLPYKKIEIVLRGRGARASAAKQYGFTLNYHRDLPIKYAKRVAVYVTIRRRVYNG